MSLFRVQSSAKQCKWRKDQKRTGVDTDWTLKVHLKIASYCIVLQ